MGKNQSFMQGSVSKEDDMRLKDQVVVVTGVSHPGQVGYGSPLLLHAKAQKAAIILSLNLYL